MDESSKESKEPLLETGLAPYESTKRRSGLLKWELTTIQLVFLLFSAFGLFLIGLLLGHIRTHDGTSSQDRPGSGLAWSKL
jgi:hypothetical protein